MKIKVQDASGIVLDWLVAKCEGDVFDTSNHPDYYTVTRDGMNSDEGIPCYSAAWEHGGPIIEREGITTSKEDGGWTSYFRDNLFEDDGSEHWQTGPTPLVAAMRCFVASKLGEEVEIPEELT